MKKLYIDVDGVLLTKHHKPAEDVREFIGFALVHFDCYWLTTHCKGNEKSVLNYLKPFVDEELFQQLSSIKPTNWDVLKTDAIDFSSDFYWLEDNPFESELRVLKKQNCEHRLIRVNLTSPRELKRVKNVLQQYLL